MYCVLDFEKVLSQIKKHNEIYPRKAVTQLISDYERNILPIRSKKEIVNLNSVAQLMEIRSNNNQNPLPFNVNDKSRVKFNVNKKYTREQSMSYVDRLITKISLREDGVLTDRMDIEYVEDESGMDINLKNITDVMKLLKPSVYGVSASMFLNIAWNNIYTEDNINSNDRELLRELSKFYIPKQPRLFGGCSYEEFFSKLMGPAKISRKLEFKGQYRLVELYTDGGNKGPKVVVMVNSNGMVVDKENNDLWVRVVQTHGDERERKRAAVWLSMNIMSDGLQAKIIGHYPSHLLDGLVSRLINLISKSEHVYIAGEKGIGKSSLIRNIPDNILVIDSDVKGSLYTWCHNANLFETKSGTELLYDSSILNALVGIIDGSLQLQSYYEFLAAKFLRETLGDGNILDELGDEMRRYRLIKQFHKMWSAADLRMTNANWFQSMCGMVLNAYNVKHGTSKSKVIQFFHTVNEMYGAMGNANILVQSPFSSLTNIIKRAAVHDDHENISMQLFLNVYYNVTIGIGGIQTPIHALYRALGKELMDVV